MRREESTSVHRSSAASSESVSVLDGVVRLAAPSSPGVVEVPIGDVSSFVVVRGEAHLDPLPVLSRQVSIVAVPARPERDALVVVLRTPRSFDWPGPTRPGAAPPIDGHDAITIALRNSAEAAQVLRGAGVREVGDVASALATVVGVPGVAETESPRRAALRRYWLPRAVALAGSLWFAATTLVVLWLRISGELPPTTLWTGAVAGFAFGAAAFPYVVLFMFGRFGALAVRGSLAALVFLVLGVALAVIAGHKGFPWSATSTPLTGAIIAMASASAMAMFLPPASSSPTVPGAAARHTRARPGVNVVVVGVSALILAGSVHRSIADERPWARAIDAALAPSDLPQRWTMAFEARKAHPSVLATTMCGSDALVPGHVAAASAGAGLDERVDGQVFGYLIQLVAVAKGVDEAEREIAAVHAPGYLPCTKRAVVRDTRDDVDDATAEPEVFHERFDLPTGLNGVEGVVDRFELRYPRAGRPRRIHVAFVRMRVEELIIRLPVVTYGVPLEDGDLGAIVEAAAVSALAAG